MSARSRPGEADGDPTGDNAPSFPGDAATGLCCVAGEAGRIDLAADDAVCLSATEIRRGDDARGDWGGDAAGDDAASSSRNANGPPAVAGGSVASSSSSFGAVLGDWGDWGEPGDLGDLGGDGAGDLAGDLAGDGAGDPAGDRVAGCAVAGVVRVPAVEDDARPLAYCAWRSTRETLRFGVVLAPHAGLGAVLGLDFPGVGSYGERAADEDDGGGGVERSSALRLPIGDAGAP